MRNAKLNYEEVPVGFQHCASKDCPLAGTCLRQRVYENCTEQEVSIRLINPAYAKRAGEDCKYYHPVRTMRYAYGFKHMLSNLPKQTSDMLRNYLHGAMGHTQYYRARRGELKLDVEDQQHIIRYLRRRGVELTEPFDHYEEHIVYPNLQI